MKKFRQLILWALIQSIFVSPSGFAIQEFAPVGAGRALEGNDRLQNKGGAASLRFGALISRGLASRSKRKRKSSSMLPKQRKKALPLLKEFRAFLRPQFVINGYIIQEAIKCAQTWSKMNSETCVDFLDYFQNQLLPEFHEMRILAALEAPEEGGGHAPDLTETSSVFEGFRYKINPSRRDHVFHLYSRSPLLSRVSNDLQPKQLDALSADELAETLLRYKEDGKDLAVNSAVSSNGYDSRRDAQLQEIESWGVASEDAEMYMSQADRNHRTNLRMEINRGRYDHREEYRKSYFEMVQENPILAFMQMPLDETREESPMLYIKRLLCDEDFQGLANDRDALFGLSAEDVMMRALTNPYCASDEVPTSPVVAEMSKMPRYQWEPEAYLTSFREALEVMLKMNKRFWAYNGDDDDDDEGLKSDEVEYNVSDEDRYEVLRQLVFYGELFEKFKNSDMSAWRAKIRGLTKKAAALEAEVTRVEPTSAKLLSNELEKTYAELETAVEAADSRADSFEFVKKDYENYILKRDLIEAGIAVALGVACGMTLRRIPALKELVEGTAKSVAGRWLAGFAVCTLVPGLAANIIFMRLINDRHLQGFDSFFSSLADLEVSPPEDMPVELEPYLTGDGHLQSKVLTKIDELNDRDTELLLELIMFPVGTGAYEFARPLAPFTVKFLRKLFTKGPLR